jgi:ribosomal protein S18 acetylase RimI-like enzyme
VCLVGPLVDPLRGESLPTVLVLHVDPALRHRGVAHELIEEATRVLAARGLQRLAARVGHNDDALISMGERWGFVRSWGLMVRE